MMRFAVACVLAATVPVLAADPPKATDAKAAAKKLAQAMGDATLKGDYAVVFDHTYEPALKPLGGRKAAEGQVQELLKQMEKLGLKLHTYTVGEPGDLHPEGANTFLVVPTVLEMTTPDGRLRVPSYLLGISPDAGRSWKFVDGAGLKDKKARDEVLPKMPAKFELPEPKQPELVKGK